MKIRAVLGPDAEDDREVHVKTVIEGVGLPPNSKGVSQAMYKDGGEDDTDELAF